MREVEKIKSALLNVGKTRVLVENISIPVLRRLLDKGGQLVEADHLPIILLSHVSGVWALVQEGAVAPSLLVSTRILADIRNIINQGQKHFFLCPNNVLLSSKIGTLFLFSHFLLFYYIFFSNLYLFTVCPSSLDPLHTGLEF